jgi:hypothetical protein
MNTSIKEAILENIKTTLEAITVTKNGYNNTITSVQRWNKKGNDIRLIPTIVINVGPESKEPGPDPQTTCKLSVNLDVWTRQDDDATESSDTVLNSLDLDIEKALMADYTRGGYAEETSILSVVPFESAEGKLSFGLIIEVQILYKHKFTDPALYV